MIYIVKEILADECGNVVGSIRYNYGILLTPNKIEVVKRLGLSIAYKLG